MNISSSEPTTPRKKDPLVPKNCLESKRVTDNLILPDNEKRGSARQIGFTLKEISNLFTGNSFSPLSLSLFLFPLIVSVAVIAIN